MFSLDDTIAAIATPPGNGGIGIIKISGPEAPSIVAQIFRLAGQRASFTPRYLHYGHITDPETQSPVDEAMAVYMPAPHSYTTQDVVEIHTHGGTVATQTVLKLVLSQGARLAAGGEMTMRAFINGRIDLSQAEAVLDIINAKTEAGLRLATQQLGGQLSGEVSQIRQGILNTLAFLEASIDFVEEDIPNETVIPPLETALNELTALLKTAAHGLIYRQGVRTAIVGQPNVGKSSLLNALLRGERAIVTNIPGTTRDTLEETVNIGGLPLVLVDTAGIRHSPSDAVEQIGIERSQKALQQADLALMVVDNSQPLNAGDWAIAEQIGSKTTLLILNKQDLSESHPIPAEFLPPAPRIGLSALTGAGLKTLEETIIEQITDGQIVTADETIVTNPRHQAQLIQAQQALKAAIEAQKAHLSPDLVSIDVREAVEALGAITGENVSEDLLDTIFSRFCIGK